MHLFSGQKSEPVTDEWRLLQDPRTGITSEPPVRAQANRTRLVSHLGAQHPESLSSAIGGDWGAERGEDFAGAALKVVHDPSS